MSISNLSDDELQKLYNQNNNLSSLSNEELLEMYETGNQPKKQNSYTYPQGIDLKHPENVDKEAFKRNIDEIYNIPQVEIPQRGVLANSDGVVKEESNKPLSNSSISSKDAEIARIKADFEAKNKEIDRQHRKNMGRIGAGALLEVASLHPILNIPYVGTGLGGALFEAGNAIMEGKKAKDIAKDAGIGFAVGESVGAIPYVGKYASKTKAGQAVANKVAPTVESLLNSSIGKKTGDIIGKLGAELNKPRTFINPSVEKSVKAEIVKPTQQATQEALNIVKNEPIEAVKEQALVEMKPSKLKSTMQNAGTLPKELETKSIDYEVIHNADSINRAKELVANNPQSVQADLLKKMSQEGDYKDYVLSADDVVNAKELVTKLYDEGNTQDAIDLTERIIKSASKTGQALQAYTLWGRTTPDGAVAYAQKMLNRYNKDQHKNLKLSDEQANEIRNLAKKIQETTEGTRENDVAIAQMQKYIADLTPANWAKKLDTYRYVNMLLSTKSRLKDFALTGMNSLDTAIDETIANGIDALRSKITKTPRAFSGLNPSDWGRGFKKGFSEGLEDVNLGINTARSGETGRYGIPTSNSFNFKPVFKQGWNSLTENPLANALNNVYAGGEKALKYALQVPDRAFYEARFSSSLANQMKSAGLEKPTKEMLQQAHKEALEAVYQDNSWVSKLGTQARNTANTITESLESNLGLPTDSIPRAGNFLAPFVTTPANVINSGLKNTAGAVIGVPKLLKARTPQEIRDAEMLIAKNIKGLGVGAGIGEAVHQGAINSNIGENNYGEDAVTGLKPNSLAIGDKAISLKDYPQWSIPINVYLGARDGGFPQAISNTMQSIGDISSLKSVGDVMKAFEPRFGEAPTGQEIADNITRSIGVNMLSQAIPFGGALGELRNVIDPYSREMFADKVPNYVKNRLYNRLPVLSKTLPIKYNAIGQPTMINNIENPLGRVASEAIDIGVRNYNNDELYKELSDFQDKIKDSDYKGKTKVGLHTPSKTIKVNGEDLKLDNQQYSDFSADYTKINYLLKGMAVNDEEYKKMTDEEKSEYLSDIRSSVEEAVKMMQFEHTPDRKLKPYTQYILDNYNSLIID